MWGGNGKRQEYDPLLDSIDENVARPTLSLYSVRYSGIWPPYLKDVSLFGLVLRY